MLYAFLIIIIQIVVESFPISSSGHLELLERFFCLVCRRFPSITTGFDEVLLKFPMVTSNLVRVLHIPTVLLVLIFFRHELVQWLSKIRITWPITRKIIMFVCIADFVTILFFIPIKIYALCDVPLSVGFAITACILFSLRFVPANKRKSYSFVCYPLIIGIVQGCALFSGVSRFGSVYAAARWLGLAPQRAFMVVWLVQCPLICAAGALGLKRLYDLSYLSVITEPSVVAVIGVASCLGYAALFYAAHLAYRHQLWRVAYYLIIPMILACVL